MPNAFMDLKRKIADLYKENEKKLNELDPDVLDSFVSRLLELIRSEKEKSRFSHDLDVLEESMRHLKNDLAKLKASKPGTDDYDFAANDCKNLIKSTEKWLKMEGLI